MPELKILKYPNPLLRKKANPVTKAGPEEERLLSEMARIMYLSKGVGLAATQVGIDKRLIVIDIGYGLLKMINPAIAKKSIGCETEEEGCLSVPDTSVKIKRAKKVTITFLNSGGEARQMTAEGLLARAFQHEIDHLNGRLIVDYLGPIKRLVIAHRKRKH